MREKPASLFICAGCALEWQIDGSQAPPETAIGVVPIGTTYQRGTSIMRRRPIIRKAVKAALIAKAAQRLGRRAEKHLKRH